MAPAPSRSSGVISASGELLLRVSRMNLNRSALG